VQRIFARELGHLVEPQMLSNRVSAYTSALLSGVTM
jgi:hypothetical protein